MTYKANNGTDQPLKEISKAAHDVHGKKGLCSCHAVKEISC
jgi:inosine-uridine nucleoside N-ribohydrolase